jgi:small GTP-binding protein
MSDSILKIIRQASALTADSEILNKQSTRIAALGEKLERQNITVSVIGQFKRGKSALVNAVLEEELLPVGIIPITSAVTEISYGKREASVRFKNGVVKTVAMEELGLYINEQENPENALGVSSVCLHTPSPFLKSGLTFVDTPGVGSFHRHNSDAAYAFVKESDAVIFMLSVDTPINEIEIDFLKSTRTYAAKFFFVVNKIDLISKEDLKIYLDYCEKLLCSLMNQKEIILFPISAKTGKGIQHLKTNLQVECKTKIRDILEASARLKLKDMVIASLAQIELYWKVLLMPPLILKETLDRMHSVLADFKSAASDTVKDWEADREIIIPGLADRLKVQMNELKIALSASVEELFGLDYHYALQELRLSFADEANGENALAKELGNRFMEEVDAVCAELESTMNRILFYRNDSTVEIVTRIYGLNRITRQLKRIRDSL